MEDLKSPKPQAAEKRLNKINPGLKTETLNKPLSSENTKDWIQNYDIVIDGTDQFSARYLIHDSCYTLGKPYVYGAVSGFTGQASIFLRGRGPCYHCLFPRPAQVHEGQSCAEFGVFGPVPGIIGSIQAAEALKWILGIGTPLLGKLLILDALDSNIHYLKLNRRPGCPVCHLNSEKLLPMPKVIAEKPSEKAQLIDLRTQAEYTEGHIPGAICLPMKDLENSELHTLFNPKTETVLYCGHGLRSLFAISVFRSAGFEKVSHIKGGYQAWCLNQNSL